MAMQKYGADGSNLVINGIPIDDFGDTDPPITIEDLEAPSQLKRGLGGGSLRMDNVTRPLRVTVNLLPGSDQSKQLKSLVRSGADLTLSFSQSGTGERVIAFDGVSDPRGNRGRGGKTTVSDDQFVFVFNDSEET